MFLFSQFIAVKIPRKGFYKLKKKKKQRRERGEAKVWPPAREMKFSRDHPVVRVYLDCMLPLACVVQRRLWFQIFIFTVVLGIRKQHYSRDPEVSYNFIALSAPSFRHETEKETQ